MSNPMMTNIVEGLDPKALLPCPLCAALMSVEQFVGWDGEDLPVKHVTHAKSSCPLASVQFEANSDNIAAWNTRSPDTAGLGSMGEPVGWFIFSETHGYQQVAAQHNGEPDLIPLYAPPVGDHNG